MHKSSALFWNKHAFLPLFSVLLPNRDLEEDSKRETEHIVAVGEVDVGLGTRSCGTLWELIDDPLGDVVQSDVVATVEEYRVDSHGHTYRKPQVEGTQLLGNLLSTQVVEIGLALLSPDVT